MIFFVVGCPRNASNSSINSHLACLSPLSSPQSMTYFSSVQSSNFPIMSDVPPPAASRRRPPRAYDVHLPDFPPPAAAVRVPPKWVGPTSEASLCHRCSQHNPELNFNCSTDNQPRGSALIAFVERRFVARSQFLFGGRSFGCCKRQPPSTTCRPQIGPGSLLSLPSMSDMSPVWPFGSAPVPRP